MKYDSDGNFVDMNDREIVSTGRRWAVVTLVVVLLLAVIVPVVAWQLRVSTSNIKGKGDAAVIKNSAVNRIQSQAQFHSDFESVRALDLKLDDASAALNSFNAAHPNVGNGTAFDPMAEQQSNLQTSVNGIQQQCRNVVARYDASTEQYTARDFRDADLPYKIRSNDQVFTSGQEDFAAFDCLPTTSK